MASITAYLKAQYGMDVLRKNEDGSVRVKYYDSNAGEEVERNLDASGLVKADLGEAGQSPELINKVSLSAKNAPLNDVALSFGEQVQFAKAKTNTDKYNALTKFYGKEKVGFNEEQQEFTLRSGDGEWRRVNAGFVPELIGSSGAAIVGGIAGAKAGAAIGGGAGLLGGPAAPVTSPIGAVVGAAIGGVTGAMAGKTMTIAEAHQKGLRTELDYADAAKEIGMEGLMFLGGEAAGYALKHAAQATAKGVVKVLEKGGGVMAGSSPGVRKAQNQVVSMLGGFTDPEVNAIREMPALYKAGVKAEDEFYAKVISPAQQALREANDPKALQLLEEAPSMMRAKQAIQETMEATKKKITQDYGAAYREVMPVMKKVKISGEAFDNALASISDDPAKDTFFQALKKSGVADDAGEGLFKSTKFERASTGGDPTKQRLTSLVEHKKLTEVMSELQTLQRKAKANVLSLDDLHLQSQKINDHLAAGQKFSSEYKRLLSIARSNVENLSQLTINNSNNKALQAFTPIRTKYAEQMTRNRNIGKKFSDTKLEASIKALLNPESDPAFRATVADYLKEAGVSPTKILNELHLASAIKRSGNWVRPNRTASDIGSVFSAVTTLVQGPKMAGKMAAWLGELQTKARVTQAIQKMSPGAVDELIKTPGAVEALQNTIKTAPALADQQAKAAVSKVAEAVQTGNTQAVNAEIQQVAKGLQYQQQLAGFQGNISRTSSAPFRPDLKASARESNLAKGLSAIEKNSNRITKMTELEAEILKPNISAGEFNKIINKAYKAGMPKVEINRLKAMRPKK